jgi:hypothetical protein
VSEVKKPGKTQTCMPSMCLQATEKMFWAGKPISKKINNGDSQKEDIFFFLASTVFKRGLPLLKFNWSINLLKEYFNESIIFLTSDQIFIWKWYLRVLFYKL